VIAKLGVEVADEDPNSKGKFKFNARQRILFSATRGYLGAARPGGRKFCLTSNRWEEELGNANIGPSLGKKPETGSA